MHVLVTGGTGLIGSAVVARLLARGHRVTGMARSVKRAERQFASARWIKGDIAQLIDPAGWVSALQGIDAVVNCAGVLQDGPHDTVRDVHATGIAALVAACMKRRVNRLIHFSAIGVDREAPSAFSRTKLEGDRQLLESDLDWVILRPSVVLGRPVYGASALFRALAVLPILPVMPRTGPLQVVMLDDVVETVMHFLDPGSARRVALDLAGPQRLSFADVVQHYRRWLGNDPAHMVQVPDWLARVAYAAGDLAGALGWRPPIRTTARREITRGAVGNAKAWTELTRIEPRSLEDALLREPAGVQERWFAGLYLLKPLIFTVFSLFWIGTGILSIGPSFDIGIKIMEVGGAGAWSAPSVIAGGVADLLIGIGIVVRRFTRPALYAALGISAFYMIAGTLLLPGLWLDPLGPMLKIWPIMALNLTALAILSDR